MVSEYYQSAKPFLSSSISPFLRRYLDIEFNGFNGTVPEEFSNCLALEEFYLSNNNFDQGDLPESLCEIGGLTDLVTDCGLQNSCSRCVRPVPPEETTEPAPEVSG